MRNATITAGFAMLMLAQGTAAAADKVYVTKKGDLRVNLSHHQGYRTLELYSTGVHNQVGYEISMFEGSTVTGVARNVTRNVIVRAKNGADTIILADLSLPGNVTISTGNGDDNVVLSHTSVMGKLAVATGRHDDYVSLKNSTIFGSTSVRTNGGHDEAYISGSALEGTVKVRLGSGYDHLDVDSSNFTYYAPEFFGQRHKDYYSDHGDNSFHGGDAVLRSFEYVEIKDAQPPVEEPPVDPPVEEPPVEEPPVEEPPVVEPIVYEIGDTGPGGGIVFRHFDDSKTSGLEVSPVSIGQAAYGCANFDVDGIDLLGDVANAPSGEESSNFLRQANAQGACFSPAAQLAFDYTINSQTDWYLPSANELVEIRELGFMPGNEGTAYWSSTEDGNQNSYLVFVTEIEGFTVAKRHRGAYAAPDPAAKPHHE